MDICLGVFKKNGPVSTSVNILKTDKIQSIGFLQTFISVGCIVKRIKKIKTMTPSTPIMPVTL